MRFVSVFLLVACSAPQGSAKREEPEPPPPLVPAPAPDMVVRPTPEPAVADTPKPPTRIASEPSNPELKQLQERLGAGVMTCFGTAKLLASQGTASKKTLQWREKTVLKLCVEDRWPERVRECVATADHDQLSCTAFFTTKKQRTRWNVAFKQWVATAGK